MSRITTRAHLDEAPLLSTEPAPEEFASPAPSEAPALGSSVTRAVTLARCLRCEFEWLPRKATPVKCPHCQSILWNVPRAQQLPGKPAPTRKGKPRGAAFTSESGSRAGQSRKGKFGAKASGGAA